MFVGSLLNPRHPFGRATLSQVSPGSLAYLQRSLNDMLNETATPTARKFPVRLDVHEDKAAFHVTADVPGLNDTDLNITFDEGVLTITGERKISREAKEGETQHIAERVGGTFERRLTVSADIDADKITAMFDKGVLKITLPKTPVVEKTVKKINITTGLAS